MSSSRYKVLLPAENGEVHPLTCYVGNEGVYMYNSTLSLTSSLGVFFVVKVQLLYLGDERH